MNIPSFSFTLYYQLLPCINVEDQRTDHVGLCGRDDLYRVGISANQLQLWYYKGDVRQPYR